MTVTLYYWMIPLVLTAALWFGVAWYFGGKKYGGDYNFGAALDAMFGLAIVGAGTPTIWLAYFATLYFLG